MGAIEIKELHIKINVDNEQKNTSSSGLSGLKKEMIIAECVEQVMDIIAKQTER